MPTEILATAAAVTQAPDARADVFCSAACPELFHAVAHRHEIARPDPYDVETIHEEARLVFQRLLSRVTTPPGLAAGRILLLLGESGSGKTHLIRAFRNQVHARRLGYCGYMQMTSATNNYGRYILGHLLTSLDEPYYEPEGSITGLRRLANTLAETPHAILPGELATLRSADLDREQLTKLVYELADLVVQERPYASLDRDLVRALLYLQRDDPVIYQCVSRYLRCEDLSDYDRRILGGLVPRRNEEDPQRMVEYLGQLMWALEGVALVVCIDQLEEMYNLADAEVCFRRALGAVCSLATHVPSSLVVVSCLEDYYKALRDKVTQAIVDRLEKDPEPVRLASQRSSSEVRELVGRRLSCLYDQQEVPCPEAEATYPFLDAELDKLANLRTRDVLDWCGKFREHCVVAGRIVRDEPIAPLPSLPPIDPKALLRLQQAWNDFQAASACQVPQDEAGLAALFACAAQCCAEELTTGHWVETEVEGRILRLELHGPDNSVTLLLAGVCNKDARGGGLARQIQEVQSRAGEHTAVLLRSTDYPARPDTQIAEVIGQHVARGGRRVVVGDSEWRAMLAYRDFRRQHEQDAAFTRWLREDRPLSRLKALRDVLALDTLRPAAPAASPVAPPAVVEVTPVVDPAPPAPVAPPPSPAVPCLLGVAQGRAATPVVLEPDELTRHAAFLGGSGSGKTTLALNVIEQLLLRGIPAVLLDRKGDLCSYALPEIWTRPLEDAERARRRDALRQGLDIALFTPGNPAGRPLAIPIVPDGVEQLPPHERELVVRYAAFGLGGMMGYKERGQDASRLAILNQAVRLLAEWDPPGQVTLDELIRIIGAPDPALLAAIGHLESKLCKRLAQDLETLRLNKRELLRDDGDRLDAERLLGLGAAAVPGKTRLSIVSTKFLGDNTNIEFWVAQLLLELTRWANRQPAKQLQAVLLLDEADMYLPAQRKPATKEPLENLLRRARSAGLGVLLASQSPGDFDYRCRDNVRTWFLGRITQQTSLAKMKPMLSDCKVDVAARLPGQQAGQFFVVRDGDVVGMQAQRSFLQTEQLADDVILRLARGATTASGYNQRQ